jgi:hypothetical protein
MRRAVLFVIVALGACKAPEEKCEKAVRNFAELTFWKKANAEIAAAPEDQRAALRKKKLAQFTMEIDQKIDVVVSQCRSANNKDQIECMIDAKTADEALECADLVKPES